MPKSSNVIDLIYQIAISNINIEFQLHECNVNGNIKGTVTGNVKGNVNLTVTTKVTTPEPVTSKVTTKVTSVPSKEK